MAKKQKRYPTVVAKVDGKMQLMTIQTEAEMEEELKGMLEVYNHFMG